MRSQSLLSLLLLDLALDTFQEPEFHGQIVASLLKLGTLRYLSEKGKIDPYLALFEKLPPHAKAALRASGSSSAAFLAALEEI